MPSATEGDFRLTQDGHVVCIHDEDTRRISTTTLVVRNSTLADLQAINIDVPRGRSAETTHIPTIADVFSTVPDRKRIYVEIKCGTAIIPALLREIDNAGLTEEQILVISFDPACLKALKAKAPQPALMPVRCFIADAPQDQSPLATASSDAIMRAKE